MVEVYHSEHRHTHHDCTEENGNSMISPTEKFAVARSRLLAEFASLGWMTSSPSLKIPHATSPDRRHRFWLKPQAVYYSFGSSANDMHAAHSVTMDMRGWTAERLIRVMLRDNPVGRASPRSKIGNPQSKRSGGKLIVVAWTETGSEIDPRFPMARSDMGERPRFREVQVGKALRWLQHGTDADVSKAQAYAAKWPNGAVYLFEQSERDPLGKARAMVVKHRRNPTDIQIRERFDRCVRDVGHKRGIRKPEAICAKTMRAAYGDQFQEIAAKGRSLAAARRHRRGLVRSRRTGRLVHRPASRIHATTVERRGIAARVAREQRIAKAASMHNPYSEHGGDRIKIAVQALERLNSGQSYDPRDIEILTPSDAKKVVRVLIKRHALSPREAKGVARSIAGASARRYR
jgi:hypothetical protein